MKKCLIYLFVVMLCTGSAVLAQAGQLAISILGSEDITSSEVVKGIVITDVEEWSEEGARESVDEEDLAKIAQQQNLPWIRTASDLNSSRHFIACIEHFAEMALLPPEL